jgi:hypothetical protein
MIGRGREWRGVSSVVYRYDILALSAVVLSGCGVSQTSYATSREALRGSSGLRNDFVTTCTRNISRKPLRTRQGIAKLMNISVRNTPRTYCSRLTRGITSGRLSHSDISAASRGQVTPAIIRVLQGR